MNFRLATTEDLPQIMQIIQEAQRYLKSQQLDQWQDGYPLMEDFFRDIEQESCYLLLSNQEIAAVMVVSLVPEPVYSRIEGEWLSHLDYAVIHRAAIAQKFRRQGISKQLFQLAEKIARDHRVHSVRVDTHEQNLPMRRAIERAGFTFCGNVYYQKTDGTPQLRVAYEKCFL